MLAAYALILCRASFGAYVVKPQNFISRVVGKRNCVWPVAAYMFVGVLLWCDTKRRLLNSNERRVSRSALTRNAV